MTEPADSRNFYKSLPFLTTFSQIFSEVRFQKVPDDWWIVLTDVIGSTVAIEAGRYKEVNSAGGIAVMALANHFGDMQFPFIFGGDGMTCLVPSYCREDVRQLMTATVRHVEKAFGLNLRLAMIPVKDLFVLGKTLSLAKWKVSPYYTQAILEGDGIDQAETFMKTPGNPYLLDPKSPTALEPNFTGYTCRWQDFPSPFDETAALLVKFRHNDPAKKLEFLEALENLIGGMDDHHPLSLEKSRLSFSSKRLNGETAVFLGTTKGWKALVHRMKLRVYVLTTLICMTFNLHKIAGTRDISQVRQDNIQSSDFRKYDNCLKMVVALKRENRRNLETKLAEEYSRGNIFYGIHVTNRAMITCLLQNTGEDEVHFVDAADGGYAMAAKMMKKQIKEQ